MPEYDLTMRNISVPQTDLLCLDNQGVSGHHQGEASLAH